MEGPGILPGLIILAFAGVTGACAWPTGAESSDAAATPTH